MRIALIIKIMFVYLRVKKLSILDINLMFMVLRINTQGKIMKTVS